MRKSRFSGAQIFGMIKEQEAGMPTAEVCRRHGLSPASFYKFKSKYGGMNIPDTHRLKSLEDENAKLSVRRRRGRKRARGSRTPMPVALKPNERWSLDFVSDTFGASPSSQSWEVNGNVPRVTTYLHCRLSL